MVLPQGLPEMELYTGRSGTRKVYSGDRKSQRIKSAGQRNDRIAFIVFGIMHSVLLE